MAISNEAKLRIYLIALDTLDARRKELDAEIEALHNEIRKMEGRPAKSKRAMGRFVRKRRQVSKAAPEAAHQRMLQYWGGRKRQEKTAS